MSKRRVWAHALSWCFVAVWIVSGCATAPGTVSNASYEDDFGSSIRDDSEITAETVQLREMMHQRTQVELRVGPSFTFDLFDPSAETRTDDSFVLGGAASIEVAKNFYVGFESDWASHDVDSPSSPAAAEPIHRISKYDRISVLGTFDYDIPFWEASDALLLRLGFGIGAAIILPESVDAAQKIDDIYQILFRPSIGLRWPVLDNMLLFTEAYYDIIPERSLTTVESQRVDGVRPVFSNGAIIFGIAFQF